MDLKEALLETVSCMLSANNDIRRLAEERQKALEVTDDYSVHLAEIVLTTEEALEERQMANVLLRRYVRSHWTLSAQGFIEPMVNDIIKRKLKNVLPMGLSDVIPKIRTAVASSLAVIAASDFPDCWPEMTSMTVSKLHSANPDEVSGTLEYLDECSKLFTQPKLAVLAPEFYDALYRVCDNEEFPTPVRSLAISVISCLLFTDQNVQKIPSSALITTLERFGNLFIMILNQPYSQKSDFCLKGQIIKFLYTMECHWPHTIHNLLEKMLPIVWEILAKCNTEYIKVVMNVQNYPLDFTEFDVNHPIYYTNLVDNLFSLLENVLLHFETGRAYLMKSLCEMLCYIMTFMSITSEHESNWTQEEELYYSDECEDSVQRSLRSHVRNVLIVLVRTSSYDLFVSSLGNALNRTLDNANRLKQESEAFWWRTHESMMYTVGTVSTTLEKEMKPMFNVRAHLTFWMNFIGPEFNREHMFLFARALWVGGKLSKFLNRDELVVHMNAILDGMASTAPVIKISSVRAVLFHCQKIAGEHQFAETIDSRANVIIDRLINVASEMQFLYTNIFECIQILVCISDAIPLLKSNERERFTLQSNHICIPNHLQKVLLFLRTTFWKCTSNAEIMRKWNGVIAKLSSNQYYLPFIYDIILPDLLKAMSNRTGTAIEICDYQSFAILALRTIIENTPLPINSRLVEEGFMIMYKVVLTVDDPVVLQVHSASLCICSFLVRAASQVYDLSDSNGQNGADFVVNVIRHMLDPQLQEISCEAAGRLCITALKYLSTAIHSQHLDCIIKSSLTRMNYINNVSIEESLINIFAYLCNSHTDTLINTLSVIPGPDGDSALAYMFMRWLTQHRSNYGAYGSLRIVALGKILEHAVLKNDERLLNVKLPAETKKGSDRQSQEFEQAGTPLLVKIFKVLTQTLVHELRPTQKPDPNSNEKSEESDKYENMTRRPFDDYVFTINVGNYLINYMRTFCQTSYFYDLVNYLTDLEKIELQQIGITAS